MSYYIDNESVQLTDEDGPAGAWMDIQDVGKDLHVDVTGPTYMDADNYPTSAFFNIRLNLSDALILREYLDLAIERMQKHVE